MTEDIKVIKLAENLFVGIQDKVFDPTKPSLGYMALYDKEDAALAKKKSSIKAWGAKATGFFPNIPTRGFTMGESVSRYSTSNKFLEIADPRGFRLQLSIENLSDLLSQATIVKGVIQDDCVWARHGGSVDLVLVDSDAYRFATKPTFKKEDLKVNDVVLDAQGNEKIYLGHKYVVKLKREADYEHNGYNGNYKYTWKYSHSTEKEHILCEVNEKDDEVTTTKTLKIKEVLRKNSAFKLNEPMVKSDYLRNEYMWAFYDREAALLKAGEVLTKIIPTLPEQTSSRDYEEWNSLKKKKRK